MSGTDLILMALVAIIVGSYVFFICWLDKIYDQARHDFFFPDDKMEEETKQDKVEKLDKDEQSSI